MTATASNPLPGIAPAGLDRFIEAGVLSATDVAAAAGLVRIARGADTSPDPDLRAWIAMGLALRAPRDGHTCVPLAEIAGRCGGATMAVPFDWPTDADGWRTVLATAGPLVGEANSRAPFVLEEGRLYLGRSRHEEMEIARRLTAMGDRLEILLGGPGTGKTTQVAIRLVDLFREDPTKRIALAAPTGKAAARMKEALLGRLDDEHAPAVVRNAPQEVRDAIIAADPTTIHALVGSHPDRSPRYAYNATSQLTYELVVVDEASMISSSLMHHLLEAIDDTTRLMLVGDPNQLASVEAGSVLGDIAAAAGRPGSRLAGRATTLTVRHRFGPRIGALADAILRGAAGVAEAFDVLERRWACPPDADKGIADDPDSVNWVQPGTAAFDDLMRQVVDHAGEVREAAQAADSAHDEAVARVLATQRRLQVLCAHREGTLGVTGRNAFVERKIGVAGGPQWYSGRPVLVTVNDRGLGLNNGDTGVVVPETAIAPRQVVFPFGKGVRRVPVSRLANVATVHALTIHKSQGSEYSHVVVILPEKPSLILTRELLYTGVTRARDNVTVVGSREVIEAAIRTPIRRATGLAARLGRP